MDKIFKYNSFEDKELGYYLRRQTTIQRAEAPVNLTKFKSQRGTQGKYFSVLVKIKKGKRNPRATIRGRKNRNRVKRGLNISLQNIARNRCLAKYGYSNSKVSRGYKAYEDGQHSWYEFAVCCNSSLKNVIKSQKNKL